MQGLMLHLCLLGNYSSHEELICSDTLWTDAIIQLQTKATPLHGLQSSHVDMPPYSDSQQDSAFPK